LDPLGFCDRESENRKVWRSEHKSVFPVGKQIGILCLDDLRANNGQPATVEDADVMFGV